MGIKITKNKNKNKNNAISVTERAEPVGDILVGPPRPSLSPCKDLAQIWIATPFSTHSFPSNASCPPPGVDTIIWTHCSDQRAATTLGPAETWRDEGKEGAQHLLEHTRCADSSYAFSGWRSAGGVNMCSLSSPLPYLQPFLPLEAATSASAQNRGACPPMNQKAQ